MKKALAGLLAILVMSSQARADIAIERAQTSLKAMGYYYGEVNGKANADTVAAIRRYQIRNGLQVTGELNKETVAALNSHRSNEVLTAPSAPPAAVATPAPAIARTLPAPLAPQPNVPVAPQPNIAVAPQPDVMVAPRQTGADLFAATPFEAAPSPLQRRVIIDVQSALRRRGFYRGPISGVFDPALSFSLRAYQSNAGLAPTGRFNVETLSKLGLLARQQYALPRQVYPRQPMMDEPVRGIWIREPVRRRDRDDDDHD